MKWLKKHFLSVFLVAVLLTGAGILAYPTVSDWINDVNQSRAIVSYVENVSGMDDDIYRRILERAVEYNEHLRTLNNRWNLDEEELRVYDAVLNIDGSGNMGYLSIPKIDVLLPIYHGTEEVVLQRAIGHIEGSSLPGGGAGTHCVVSGHRGLPGAKLLTDLDRMVKGDTFMLTVLNETYTYEVDQIRVVLPDNLDDLEIDPEQDYVTLVTCTPYGVNSHRLLVRGHRIENAQGTAGVRVSTDAMLTPVSTVLPAVAFPVGLLLILAAFVLLRGNSRLPSMGEVRKTLERVERMNRLNDIQDERMNW